ncbi:MAG: UDP-N-acetylglucosamine 1-carboxyvinyltransferase [Deltaproteobacteria bacterium]|nr:UDP-N-acetylglucosamine 1-carboxyvinyltransferase [Deltaproteobacteria bacterium]
MDKMIVTGGERLMGEARVSGAKNAALPLLAATLLAEGPCVIRGLPKLRDVQTMISLLARMGVRHEGDADVRLDTSVIADFEAPYDLVKTMRASTLVLGPLVARHGFARVSLPGGCAIGARPIDQHLKGLEALGAEIHLVHGYVEARAKKLRGARIVFDIPSVGATENLLMAAALAEGKTVIENAAREPEIVALADFLRAMGANIHGDGGEEIVIHGTNRLEGAEIDLIPDRIEAGTLMVAAGMTRGNVLLRNCPLDSLTAVVEKLRSTGMTIEPEDGGARVIGPARIRAADVKTQPYPGFPTDMQAQFMALMTTSQGTSVINETVFENRFMHVLELERMGAEIHVEGRTAIVRGVPILSGAEVMATDLRASASLILGALAAEGQTVIHRIYHLARGYEAIEKKLMALGARIERARE